jgi:D-galactarolactone cycloisomerase
LKIRDIKTYRLDAALAEPFAYSQAWYDHRGALLVEIVGEDELSGWGEAFGPPLLTAPIVDFYKPLLVGTDAFATELHWQNLYNRLRDHGQKGLAIEALSAVDIALWDLKGRYLGLPVHRLMGGPLRSRVQAYATGFYRKRGADPVAYLIDEARQRVDAGFSAVKLKLGFGIDEDIRLCRAIRQAIGETMTIMVDANHAYDATAAIRVGR